MTQELKPEEQATVERFGIFEPEEDDSFWGAIQAQRDPGPWVKLPTREALIETLLDAAQSSYGPALFEERGAARIADRVLALLSGEVE